MHENAQMRKRINLYSWRHEVAITYVVMFAADECITFFCIELLLS